MATVKATNRDILDAADALAGLAELRMPPVCAARVLRLSRMISAEAASIRAARDQCIDAHLLRGPDDKPIAAKDASGNDKPNEFRLRDADAYMREVAALLAQEIEVANVPVLTLHDLSWPDGRGGEREIEGRILMKLGPFLDLGPDA